MNRRPLAGALCAVGLALALPAFGAASRPQDRSKGKAAKAQRPATDPSPRPILLVANEVIERAFPSLLESPRDTAQRISVKDGLVGLGAYNPRGGADFGMYAPPRHLFPGAGVGNSLNVDPHTGRSYFTNTP